MLIASDVLNNARLLYFLRQRLQGLLLIFSNLLVELK